MLQVWMFVFQRDVPAVMVTLPCRSRIHVTIARPQAPRGTTAPARTASVKVQRFRTALNCRTPIRGHSVSASGLRKSNATSVLPSCWSSHAKPRIAIATTPVAMRASPSLLVELVNHRQRPVFVASHPFPFLNRLMCRSRRIQMNEQVAVALNVLC